ncbi:MAG: DUF2867 domain-containing protein [Flavobacteriales bacterium]
MSQISKSNIPDDSVINKFISEIDYQDCYSFSTLNNSKSIQELYIAIFSSAPKWVEGLMRFRNWIVKFFGLKTEMKKAPDSEFEVGDKVGIFKIFDIQENEIIAGEDDKHLNFRVSIYRKIEETSTISIATLVHYNNGFGRFYMSIVKPFHRLVVKSLIKKAIKKL